MMDPVTMLAIGAGTGLLKSELLDKKKEERQRKLAAATQRYSPWTGLQAQPIQEADPLGSSLSYGLTGYQIGLGSENQKLNDKLVNSEIAKNAAATLKPESSMQQAPLPAASSLQAPGLGAAYFPQTSQYNLGPTPYWSQLGGAPGFGGLYGVR